MAIDLSRFHAAFFAESAEQLDAMEAELLRWDPEVGGDESINTIFRAAHSVKGGSSTFGFSDIAGLTHLLETLLHEVRSGERSLDAELVHRLLESVDCLRDLLSAHQRGTAVEHDKLAALTAHFEALVGGPAETGGSHPAAAAGDRRWQIRFRPHLSLMQRGNDPYRLIRELADLGDLKVEASLSRLPRLADLDPECCYLEWQMVLDAAVERQQIAEIFEWVEQDCDLEISQAKPRMEPARSSATVTREVEPGLAAGGSVRVDVEKIDQLINRVGELVVTESRLLRLLAVEAEGELNTLRQTLETLSTNIRDLQDTALQMRMVPLSFAFHRLPRLVRDLSLELGKEASLEIRGEQTELDKGLLESLTDPLIHLVRNALDHGIESPEKRLAAGKPARARIDVRSFYRSGVVIIEVEDDGRGLDPDRILTMARERGLFRDRVDPPPSEVLNIIFSPGFTTATKVTDISGRGVGLDVVRRNIQRMGGRVTVDSTPGKGTVFSIEVPLTLSIIEGQLVRIGASIFVIPVLSIVQSLRADPASFERVGGGRLMYRFRSSVVPVLDLKRVWELGEPGEGDAVMLVVVEWGRQRFALPVDELMDHQSVVIKSLEENFRRVSGLAGATVLGDGGVALILDIASLGGVVGDRRRHDRPRSDRGSRRST